MDERSESRDHAVERLEAAKGERDQRAEQFDAATGSAGEVTAAAELQAAEKQIAAREAWLTWAERDDR